MLVPASSSEFLTQSRDFSLEPGDFLSERLELGLLVWPCHLVLHGSSIADHERSGDDHMG